MNISKEYNISKDLLPVLIGYIQMPASKGISIYGTVKAKHSARAQVQQRDATKKKRIKSFNLFQLLTISV